MNSIKEIKKIKLIGNKKHIIHDDQKNVIVNADAIEQTVTECWREGVSGFCGTIEQVENYIKDHYLTIADEFTRESKIVLEDE